MRYVYRCPLRWSDMDVFGHVNNARFLTLYEEARVALMFTAARQAGLTSFEEGVVISRHEIDYLRPVDYDAEVRIELWVEEIRASRFVVAYELFDERALASRARSVLVPFDLSGQRPRRLSLPERDFLTRWLAQPAVSDPVAAGPAATTSQAETTGPAGVVSPATVET